MHSTYSQNTCTRFTRLRADFIPRIVIDRTSRISKIRNDEQQQPCAQSIIIDHYGILFINTDRRKRISCIRGLHSGDSLSTAEQKITMSKKRNYVEFIVQIQEQKSKNAK